MTTAFAKLRGVVLAALGLTLGLLAPAAHAQSATDLTTYYQWDDLRRLKMKIGPDPDGPGGRPRKAEVYTYDADGQLTRTDVGTTTLTTGADFVSFQSKAFGYDAVGNRTSESVSGGSLVSLTQFSFDPDDRLVCTAVRMTLVIQGDPCAPGPSTNAGTDRITRNTYDAASQLTMVERAVGTDLAIPYARYHYSDNGKQDYVIDAAGWDGSHLTAGNKTTMTYDGFDRLIRQTFPVTTRGGVGNVTPQQNDADFEAYTYDANGNRTSLRKRAEGRDGRVAGSNIIGFEYDALNRMIWKRIPPAYKTGNVTDISYSYDLQDHMLSAAYQIPNKAVTFTYDKAGRKTEERSYGLSVYSDYDAAGNRLHLTLPGGKVTTYGYDAAGLVTSITQDGLAVASFSYDGLGRRLSLSRGADPDTTTYDFTEPGGRLASLTNSVVGANNTSTETLSYNPAGQIATLAQASPTYVWQGQPTAVRDRTFDGLNRDLTYAALDGGYDFNGNLTRDDYRSFQYDVENRLILTQNTGSSSLVQANFSQEAYDPLGRLRALYWTDGTGVNGGITYFLNDGDRMVAEYAQNALDPNAGFAVKTPLPPALRRYVHGPGTDEPLVWFEGDQTSTAYWLHANRQGSIIAVSTQSGATLSINGSPLQYTYGPYGEPQDWKGSRFRYTGQMAWGEVGLYYYKARVYDPAQGRFLQTDPIGYGDDLNLYAYVGGDPVDREDPTGLMGGMECSVLCAGPGWGKSGPAIRRATAAAVQVTAPEMVAGRAIGTIAAAVEVSPAVIGLPLLLAGDTVRTDKNSYKYVAYTRYNSITGQFYSGRTGGYGAPEEIVLRRAAGQPHLNSEGFDLPMVNAVSTNFSAIRGREQQLIDFFGGAQSVGGTTRNVINGVGDFNPFRPGYMGAAIAEFGPLPDNSPPRPRL